MDEIFLRINMQLQYVYHEKNYCFFSGSENCENDKFQIATSYKHWPTNLPAE